MLAAVVRRPNESITDLLERLDVAVGKALEDDDFTDEINTPLAPVYRESRRRRRPPG